ncbi:fibronectin type-III domain-containing protein 3a [Elysia marginata]|uniref:Fibronectin type-III domain-containing protein 3a n=1 Tax=Elysia marginata TaxID=1093978 RepID=A0AAV4F234_9GAST|nr:fibronectin type-III domain-containing protein 3a [Elysia marginata]
MTGRSRPATEYAKNCSSGALTRTRAATIPTTTRAQALALWGPHAGIEAEGGPATEAQGDLVTGVESRISQIQLTPPECDSLGLDLSDLKFELFLNKGRDDNYNLVFCGKTTELTLQDLIPYTEYNLKCCAVLGEELKGALTKPVGFRTLQCEPEAPLPPKMVQKTKTSLALKWNAACDNGSKVTTYLLEWDQGTGEDSFKEVYSGQQRQYKLVRLNASTKYMFRLAAVNAFGTSGYSEVVGFHTSGLPPSQPDPPELAERYVYALGICWKKASGGEDFLLQMEDESTGHGFMPVYNGQNQSFIVPDLKRNTAYKFRVNPPSDTGGTDITKFIVELDDGQGYDIVYEGSEREHTFDHLRPGHTYRVRVACCSTGGRSDFSDCCVATTLPVVPGHCNAPKLHGKPKATSLHLKWSCPDYDGGAQVTSFGVQMISSDNSTKEVFKGHDRACIVAGLLPGRSYLFQVQAFNRAGAGPWSEALEVVSGAGVPEAPRMPLVTCRSSHSALVSWDEPFNNGALVSEYRLEWQQRSDAVDFTQLYLGPNMSFDVKGLTPATMYTFRVQAINSAGAGQFSPAAQYHTPASSPGPISSIKVVPEATQARLSWRQPNTNGSDITSYNIDVSDRSTPLSVDPLTEYVLEGLQPETSYKLRVQAVNSIGVGPYSNSVKVTTRALPPAPPRLDCVILAPTSIKLKWGEGRHSDLLTYTLEMEKEDGRGPNTSFQLDDLTTHQEYQARVAAVRLSSDQSGDIVGAFSPGVVFSLAPTESSGQHSSSLTGLAGSSSSSSAEERRPWTDQQWAAVILLGFLLVAVVSAYVCHILVTYMGGESSNQFSSSSQSSGGSVPPSSSGHSRGNHHGSRGFS